MSVDPVPLFCGEGVSLGWTISDANDKSDLRRRMRKLRLVADQKEGPDAVLRIVRHALAGLDAIGFRAGMAVAGYLPIGTEIDIRPLLARLCDRQGITSLPVIDADGLLIFRRWQAHDTLEEGDRGTMQPLAASPPIDPDILFVPVLAVDDRGYRIGQGAGYYDRTLAALRARRPVTAVGVGYAVQHVDKVPHDHFDQPMDWILTEDGLTQVRR